MSTLNSLHPFGNISSLTDIQHIVKADFEQADLLIEESLLSDIELIQAVGAHIVHSGGKRLRPLVALLAARSVNCQGNCHIILAVIVEFLHTATLLHDDVVDASALRRGRKTANVLWGNSASVLVGDFLYSRAFQLMTRLKSLAVYALLADATNKIAQGEVLQLMRSHDVRLLEEHYLEVISCKTATLFSAAAECGVVIGQGNAAAQGALSTYGLHLGLAFQMIDDWLDYAVSAKESGKNPGDDLAEGKVTLPLIYAMQQGTSEQSDFIRKALEEKDATQINKILEILHQTNARKYILERARKETVLAKESLLVLPDSIYKEALWTLADFVVQRQN